MSLDPARVLSLEELDLRDTQLIANVLAPNLANRIGNVVGDVDRALDAIKSAAGLLRSVDGVGIASGMAAVIQAFTGWLRGRVEGDSAVERLNLSTAQATFIGPPGPWWMRRQPVGGPRAADARTRLGLKWPSTRVLQQWNPGAVYVFPRIGWDCVRRSFGRTDGANVFDAGQPDLVWTSADLELARCISRYADYWEGRGCGYNPGERIQLSAGTWPYTSGRQVQQWSGLQAVDMAGHYIALQTPSAIHVATDAGPVQTIYARWKQLAIDPLPELPQQGQADDGVYRKPDGTVYVQGSLEQTVYITVDGVKWASTAAAIQYVQASFLGFFHLREAVLRDWEFVAPAAKQAGLKSADPRVKARAAGGKYVPAGVVEAPPPNKPAGGGLAGGLGVNGRGGSGGGSGSALGWLLTGAAAVAVAVRRRR